MAASPSSAAALSEIEPPSSPVNVDKSFMTNVTEDEDTKMADATTPEASEKAPRGKRGRESLAQGNASMIGKIRHLKKDDGVPLWRVDIQFDFLRAVFDDDTAVFSNSYEPQNISKQCFADLYIDTMARSSKTSKVLRDKLLSDREAAKGMAMVCLLVNIGRMNTTLNFFPEMRAQLRTYHAIPSLQAHQDPHAYKQLQDAPRLKSILKGGAEDRQEPNTIEKIKSMDLPRTNPVNLLFVICQAAPKIAELHFPPGREFHDLIMKFNYSSESRAKAFLWIMWFYLESDFTEEGCDENPFGQGVDYGVDVANQGVPRLREMTKEEQELENQDTPEELEFGEAKRLMRTKIIASDQQYIVEPGIKRGARGARAFVPSGVADEITTSGAILPRIRPSKHESDLDSSRSTPPPRALARQSGALAGSGRRGGSLKYQIFENASPGGSQIEGVPLRKQRPPTAHQIAVENNRHQRVEYILDRGVRKAHHRSRKLRRVDGAIVRAHNRIKEMVDPFEDSEGEDNISYNTQLLNTLGNYRNEVEETGLKFRERGMGGLVLLKDELDDFGEEVSTYTASFRRIARRLDRWEGLGSGVVAPTKRARRNGVVNGDYKDPNETEEEPDLDEDMEDSRMVMPPVRRRRQTNGRRKHEEDVNMEDGDDLDDVTQSRIDMEDRGDDDDDADKNGEDDDQDLNDVDKTLLGIGDDESDSE